MHDAMSILGGSRPSAASDLASISRKKSARHLDGGDVLQAGLSTINIPFLARAVLMDSPRLRLRNGACTSFSPLSEGKQSLPLPRAHLRALEESARRQLARRFPVAVVVGRASEISRSLSFDGPITPANGPRLGFRHRLTGEHAHDFNERMRVETLMSIARSVRPSSSAARECKESRKEEEGEDFE